VHNLLMGSRFASPQTAINELKQALHGNETTLGEMLQLLKRMEKASFRWHEKYLIVDGKTAIVGGMNIADEYLKGGSDVMLTIRDKVQPAWRDTDVLLSGDAVRDIYANFRRNWIVVSGVELPEPPAIKAYHQLDQAGGVDVAIIQHRPLEDGDHKVTNFILY